MPLVDLKTNLKSLKYGHDRPGGGSSDQPYIKTDINTLKNGVIQVPDFLGFDDGLVRGGLIGAANASITDTFRIGKFLLDLPKGPLFIAKQVGLQLSNPRLETLKTSADQESRSVFSQPTRLYNLGINTIAQIPVNAFGLHFDRHGLLPVQSDQTKYENVVEKNNENNANRLIGLAQRFSLGDNISDAEVETLSGIRKKTRQENRAEKQRIRKINADSRAEAATTLQVRGAILSAMGLQALVPSLFDLPLSSFGYHPLRFKRTKPDFSQLFIDRYVGGPSSVYGIGTTTINRSDYTELKKPFDDAIFNSITKAGKFLYKGERQEINFIDGDEPILANFIGELSDEAIQSYPDILFDTNYLEDTAKAIARNPRFTNYAALYNQIEAQKALITGSANQVGIYNTIRNSGGLNSVNNAMSYWKNTDVYQIKYTNSKNTNVILNRKYNTWFLASNKRSNDNNKTPLFISNIATDPNNNTLVHISGSGTYDIDDLVPFRIQAIDGDDPNQSVFMVFRAFITDLSDDTNADWSEIKYAGRGEKFYVYSGFNRKLNISFKVAALSAEEMSPMYQKLNNLIGNLSPDYTNANSGLMRGPFTRMTIGNWIENQPGIINTLSYKVSSDSPWEVNMDDSPKLVLPHIVEVNLSFTPIGVQTKTETKIPNKASKTQLVSNIAQSYYGGNPEIANYIDGTIEKGDFNIK